MFKYCDIKFGTEQDFLLDFLENPLKLDSKFMSYV